MARKFHKRFTDEDVLWEKSGQGREEESPRPKKERRTKMSKFWASEKVKKIVSPQVVIGEVFVTPAMPRRRARNLARMETIQQAVKSMVYGSDEYIAFAKEFDRRKEFEEIEKGATK
jgi:hypothetical protein